MRARFVQKRKLTSPIKRGPRAYLYRSTAKLSLSLSLCHERTRIRLAYAIVLTDQPTINEATNNVVDGINLDEIKEFAKVFKLRRLSLGLTQTQVGQALSVTEGPAYSQSAICRLVHAPRRRSADVAQREFTDTHDVERKTTQCARSLEMA